MSPRIVAVMVGMGVVIGLLAGLLIGALVFRPGTRARPMPVAVAPVPIDTPAVEVPVDQATLAPEGKTLFAIADRICQGDQKAVSELIAESDKLYQGVDFQRDTQRVQGNFTAMSAAFTRIGQAAGASNPSAMLALQKCAATGRHVGGFAANALGNAAAAGNTEALDMLLHYDQFGILQSTAVSALRRSADAGNAEAIDFLARVLEDPQARPMWNMASTGLRRAASQGNSVAIEALQRYDAAAQRAK